MNLSPEQFAFARGVFDALCEHPSAERRDRLAAWPDLNPELRAHIANWLDVITENDSGQAEAALAERMSPQVALGAWLEQETHRQSLARVGESHGHFRLLEAIGQGGMGKVSWPNAAMACSIKKSQSRCCKARRAKIRS